MHGPLMQATPGHEARPRGPQLENAPLPAPEPEAAPGRRRPEHALSDDFVRTVDDPGRYCDGQGLYLDVQPSGSRSWVQRLAVRGRRRELGLGSFPLVSLDEARAQAFAVGRYLRGQRREHLEREYLETYHRTDERVLRVRQLPDSRRTRSRRPGPRRSMTSSPTLTDCCGRRIGATPTTPASSSETGCTPMTSESSRFGMADAILATPMTDNVGQRAPAHRSPRQDPVSVR